MSTTNSYAAGGFAISSPLSLSTTNVVLGQTLTGKVTFTNSSSAVVTIKSIVIAGRPPGGANIGGPYDDLTPAQAQTTVNAGASVTLTATRAFTSADPVGGWYSYATYEDASGTWHDGPSVTYTVSKTAPSPSPSPKPSGFVMSSPLQLSSTSLTAGQTLTGKVSYTNYTSAAVTIKSIVIAGRPPGGANIGGPYDDLTPSQAQTTVNAGATVMLTATRAFTSADPVGGWYSYATYEDAGGTWHDGPSVKYTVSGTTASPSPKPSASASPSPKPSASPSPKPSATPTTSPTPTPTPSQGGSTATRPSYNTGNGFFALGSKIYDANGKEFRIRGVDRAHYDSNSAAGITASHANAARVFVTTSYGKTPAQLVAIMQHDHINNKVVPIPTAADNDGSTATSCNTDTATLTTVVNNWVAQASVWTSLNKYMIVNIANEWGPSNSTTWRDSYISAVSKMRAAGYLGTLMIDAGGCGQDANDIINYGAAVFNADPQKNVIFSIHIYGNWYDSANGVPESYSGMSDLSPTMKQLGALGIPVVAGEFGPGRDIGPSPTNIVPTNIVKAAEANSIGWMGWAWDDNNLGNSESDNTWFSMTYHVGVYTKSSDLTLFGQEFVEGCSNPNPGGCGCPDAAAANSVVEPGCKGTPNPQYGNANYSLKIAVPATIF